MKFTSLHSARSASPQRQGGMVSILIAIIVLVVSLLAAAALMRSVDTSNAIAGSMAFRQEVLQEAEKAYGNAKININFGEPSSDTDQTTLGYYSIPKPATIRPDKDIPDMLVNATACPTSGLGCLTNPSTGNIVFYIVERLCPTTGPAVASACIVPGASIQGGSVSNQTKDNGPPFTSGVNAAFRLTVKVIGPRGALAYTQTVMR